jgi:lysophospholipase L1-like esterase
MSWKYYLGGIIAIPLLPLMYFQGKKIKKSVPNLSPAIGFSGYEDVGSLTNIKLLALGESTIAGIGVNSHKEGFTGALARKLSSNLKSSIDWKVYAISGYTAEKVTLKIIPKIIEKDYDLIVIGLGGNDSFNLNSPNKWGKDVKDLILSLRKKIGDCPIYFCNIPPIKEFPAFTPLIKFIIGNLSILLGEKLKETISYEQNVFFNSEVLTLNKWVEKFNLALPKSMFFSDGVHPSKLTYETWGIDMANFITENWNKNYLNNGKLES